MRRSLDCDSSGVLYALVIMRLCQPFLSALKRSFATATLLSGAAIGLWLLAGTALARFIDGQLAHQALDAQLPVLAVAAIAIISAALLHATRATVLNRRRIWLDHGLGERVLAHELWLASEPRQQDRSLAAVACIAGFTGSRAALATVELPWSLILLAAVWQFDTAMAIAATSAAGMLTIVTLSASRKTRAARGFDVPARAYRSGHDAVRTARLASDASLDHACTVAERWEVSQRGRIASQYAFAQAAARRHALAATVVAIAAAAVLVAALSTSATGVTLGGRALVAVVAVAALLPLWRLAIDAASLGRARAARDQLLTLRVTKSHQRHPVTEKLDLRAPIGFGLTTALAATAAMFWIIVTWQVPIFTAVLGDHSLAANATDARGLVGAPSRVALVPVANAALDTEINGLRKRLASSSARLGDLKREAAGLMQADGSTDRPARLHDIEAATTALATSVTTMSERIALLERQLAVEINAHASAQSKKQLGATAGSVARTPGSSMVPSPSRALNQEGRS